MNEADDIAIGRGCAVFAFLLAATSAGLVLIGAAAVAALVWAWASGSCA